MSWFYINSSLVERNAVYPGRKIWQTNFLNVELKGRNENNILGMLKIFVILEKRLMDYVGVYF